MQSNQSRAVRAYHPLARFMAGRHAQTREVCSCGNTARPVHLYVTSSVAFNYIDATCCGTTQALAMSHIPGIALSA